jgi:hypothetical protein
VSAAEVRDVDLSSRGLVGVPVELLRYKTTIEALSLSRNKLTDVRLVAEL